MIRPFNIDKDCIVCLLPEINTTWRDQSANTNHAAPTGAVKKSGGRRGPAWYLDGVNDILTITDHASLQNLTVFTIEVWIKPSDIGGAGTTRITFRSGTGSVASFSLQISGATAGKLAFYAKNDAAGTKTVNNTGLTPANAWYHAVGVANGSTLKLWINGVAGAAGNLVGPFSFTGDWQISAPSNDFGGLIDELRVYKRVLADWEIVALYNQGKPI